MPHDMFDDLVVRPPSIRARRSPVVVASMIAHGAAILALLIAPLMASDLLPPLPHSVTFVPDSNIVPVIPAPHVGHPGGVVRATPRNPSLPSMTAPNVPLVAPPAIGADETSYGDPWPGNPETRIGDWPGIMVGDGFVLPPPPPPTSAAPSAPIHLHAGIKPPRKIVDVPPVYPAIAQQARVEGTVIIEATIDTAGHVTAARVLRPIPMLDQAALDAVRQWTYTPALLNGVPVPVVMTVTVTFKLR